MKETRRFPLQWIPPILMIALIALPACSKQTAQQAGRGAAGGAVIGAVGGLVTGLVFGGNAAEAAARGAVYGASTGAAAGAMTGAMAESSQKQQPPQNGSELEKLRTTLGEDAYSGLEALVECKHEVALAYGRTAQQSATPDYALAGLWLQVLTYADNRQEEKARAIFPELVAKDQKLASEAQAETKMREALQKLMDIREEHRRPRVCG